VTSASNGEDVLNLLDNAEAIATLRERGFSVPVIVMTGHFPDDVVQARLKGLDVHVILRKPVMISTLLNAVNVAIGEQKG
jgi:CheY-like chemotaxis protein